MGVLLRLRYLLLPRHEDDLRRPKKIFQLTNFLFVVVVLCVAVDQYLLKIGSIEKSLAGNLPLAQVALFPAIAVLGYVITIVARIISPPKTGERMRFEARGSHPAFIIVAVVILVVLVTRSPDSREAGSGASHSTQASGASPQEHDQDKSDVQSEPSFLERSLRSMIASIENLLGLQSEEDRSNAASQRMSRPDFNYEGYIKLKDVISAIASDQGVDPLLVLAVVEIGSGFNSQWDGGEAGIGLVGLPEEILMKYGAKRPNNIRDNVEAGSRYLKEMLQQFGGDIDLALAAFKGGEELVKRRTEQGKQLPSHVVEFVRRAKAVYEISKARDKF